MEETPADYNIANQRFDEYEDYEAIPEESDRRPKMKKPKPAQAQIQAEHEMPKRKTKKKSKKKKFGI